MLASGTRIYLKLVPYVDLHIDLCLVLLILHRNVKADVDLHEHSPSNAICRRE